MAYNNTTNTQLLRNTWDAEIKVNPTEETKIADFVAQPIGAEKFGNTIYLRKVPAMTAQSTTDNTSRASALTYNSAATERVSGTAVMKYSAVELEDSFLSQAIDDGNVRAAFKKQLMASIKEAIDTSLFTLASGLSHTQAGAALDDGMLRAGLGQLDLYAKNKVDDDTVKLLVIHPTQYANALNIPALKEYQIRGTEGSAVSGKLAGFGIRFRRSGLVYLSGGVTYCNPLILEDAFALAWNIKPRMKDAQMQDGILERFIAQTEYAALEWFDSSGVSLNIT